MTRLSPAERARQASKGKANPGQVNALLMKKLG